jgi:hypothetical protein
VTGRKFCEWWCPITMDTKEQEEGRLRSAVSSTENSSSRDDAQDEEEEKLPISQSDADRSVGSGGSCGPSESSSAPSTAEDIVSRGIASVLGPVVRNFDSSVDGVMSSQKALSRSIDRLTQGNSTKDRGLQIDGQLVLAIRTGVL